MDWYQSLNRVSLGAKRFEELAGSLEASLLQNDAAGQPEALLLESDCFPRLR